jgi:uncharacterized alkaline shock family protein YloU
MTDYKARRDNQDSRNTSKRLDVKKVDTKEFEFPETAYISDIDTKVFQGIVLQCLSQIDGIYLVEGNFIDNIFGKSGPEVGAGVQSEKNSSDHSVSIKVEVNILYGKSIPAKAEEIQSKVVEEITRLTGLRVSSMHVVFRNIVPIDQAEQMLHKLDHLLKQPAVHNGRQEEEYSDDF